MEVMRVKITSVADVKKSVHLTRTVNPEGLFVSMPPCKMQKNNLE